MASVAGAAVVLMLLVDCVQLESEPEFPTKLLFGAEGEEVMFSFVSVPRRQSNFTGVLYRATKEGDLFAMNSSNPSQHSDLEQAKRVVHGTSSSTFILKNLSLSDSGDYVTERWRKGMLREKINHTLVVCKDRCDVTLLDFHDHEEWVMKKNESQGNRLQVYKETNEVYYPHQEHMTVILDTRLPMESLPGDQRGEVEVSSNSTTVRLSIDRSQVSYVFLIWSGDQCCLSLADKGIRGMRGSFIGEFHFVKPGERLTLPCSRTDNAEEIVWHTPGKVLSIDVPLFRNMSHQEEEDMYIDTSTYALVTLSVEVKHTGSYTCKPDYIDPLGEWTHEVYVCPDLEATRLLFSLGDTATLVCGAEFNVSRVTYTLYQHVDQEQEHPSLKLEEMNVIKVMSAMSSGQLSLTLSNLTLNESGLYVCRMYGYTKEEERFCFDRKIYLLYKHPFGVDSTFYRVYCSLMACGLLGMVCAVISVNLRVRGRDQASQERLRRTAEGEHSEGQPESECVNTAEHCVRE